MDTALKQRLVGASVLIALAVVVLPMLLGGRPDGEIPESQKIELPPQPSELDFETRRYPIGEQPPKPRADRSAVVAKPLPSPAPAPAISDDSAAEPPPQSTSGTIVEALPDRVALPTIEIAEEPPVEVIPLATQPEDTGRYIVQVASFGAVDNAKRLSEALRGYGYAVKTDTVKSDVGTLHRVRVGPYGTESEANSVVSRLQTQVGDIKPRVMDLQPEKVAQVAKPADPLVRWVVQVGSFSSAANADRLVARLRLDSMTAYKEEVSSSGSTIYRVRVGPFLEREEAIRVDKQVMERMSIDGVVMSAN
jgi:DedD protein